MRYLIPLLVIAIVTLAHAKTLDDLVNEMKGVTGVTKARVFEAPNLLPGEDAEPTKKIYKATIIYFHNDGQVGRINTRAVYVIDWDAKTRTGEALWAESMPEELRKEIQRVTPIDTEDNIRAAVVSAFGKVEKMQLTFNPDSVDVHGYIVENNDLVEIRCYVVKSDGRLVVRKYVDKSGTLEASIR